MKTIADLNLRQPYVGPDLLAIWNTQTDETENIPVESVLGGPGNVLNHGADATGVADSTSAIQSAIDTVSADSGGTVYLPSGTYLVSQDSSNAWCLDIGGADNVTLIGDGKHNTTIRLADNQANAVRILSSQSGAVDGFSLIGIGLDGNKANQTVNEQRHGTFFANATNLLVRDVWARDFTGDGLYWADGCQYVRTLFCDATGSDRNGLTLGGSISDAEFIGINSYGNAVQQFDSEAFTDDALDNIAIIGGTYVSTTDYAMAIGGVASRLGKGWKLIGVNARSNANAIRVISCEDISLVGCTVTSGVGAYSAIEVYNENGKVIIDGCEIVSPNTGTNGGISCIATSSTLKTSHLLVSNTAIDTSGGTAQTPIRVQGVDNLSVKNVQCIGDGDGTAAAVVVRATVPIESIAIAGLTAVNTGTYAIEVAANVSTNRIESVLLDGITAIDNQGSPSMTHVFNFIGTMSQIGEVVIGDVSIFGVSGMINGSPPLYDRATTTELEDDSARVNTSAHKREGFKVFNTTTNRPVYAAGNGATDVWGDATGTTVHTPV